MPRPNLKVVPIPSAWADPHLERMFNELDARLNTFPANLSYAQELHYEYIQKARDLAEELDCALVHAEWVA